jgi:HEAT repeat protein
MRGAIPLLLLFPLASATGDESPKPPDEKPQAIRYGEVEPGEPGTKIEDAAVARDKAARFEAELRAASDERAEAELVRKLGEWDHPEILKALVRRLADKNRFVAIEAALACARQRDAAKAGPALHRALQFEKRPDVVCAQLVALGKLGYAKAYKDAEKWFRKDTTETHKAAVRYFGMIGAKEAFRMLAEKLEEPKPARIDDPKNPPASWWKERWEEWNSNLPYVKKALSQIVPGETFDTLSEAQKWAEQHGKEHGIKW